MARPPIHHYNISSNFESFQFTHSVVLVNLNNDCCHVVAANPLAWGDVTGAAVIEQLRHCAFHLRKSPADGKVTPVAFLHHKVDGFLTRLNIPNAVTGKQHKLRLSVNWFNWNIGKVCNSLFFTLKLTVVLVFKVTKALERASIPLTRPSSTKPPDLCMRASSPGLSGLWSSDISFARPPRERTVRESPELAQINSVFVTKSTVAVQPAKLLP